jgi:hypothetical protein
MGRGDFDTGEDYDIQIKPGRHLVQITRAVVAESKKGNDMISMRIHVITGPAAGAWFREWISLTPGRNGYGKLQKVCLALGVVGTRNDEAGLEPHDQASVHQHLLGRVLVCNTSVEKGEWNGKERTQIRADGYEALPVKAAEALLLKHESGQPALPGDAYEDWEGNDVRPVEGGGGFSGEGDGIPF